METTKISVRDIYLRDAVRIFYQFKLISKELSHNSQVGYGNSETTFKLTEETPGSIDAFIKSQFFDQKDQSFRLSKPKETETLNANRLFIF